MKTICRRKIFNITAMLILVTTSNLLPRMAAATVQLAQSCSPSATANRSGLSGTTPQLAIDNNVQSGFRSSFNDWQYIQLDFQCIREFRGFRRYMSYLDVSGLPSTRGVRGHRTRQQGEGMLYSIDGQTWARLPNAASFGWDIYDTLGRPSAWYGLPYGWSAWIVPSSPVYARYIRFNWDGDIDVVNELQFNFSELVLPQASTATVNYAESDEDFPNPERGFSQYSETHMSNYDRLDPNDLLQYRSLHILPDNPGPAYYNINSTLVYRVVVLKDNATPTEIQNLKNDLAADFESARQAGIKYILRFAYSYDSSHSTCQRNEPDKAIILAHITNLALPRPPSTDSFFRENKDVIALFQFGFIGNYGEGHWTNSSEFGCQANRLDPQNWQHRIEVLKAFLLNTPSDRMVQVRIPQLKQKHLAGPSAPTTTRSALTDSIAYGGSDAARIGFYNDCFLGRPSIEGFVSYDRSEPLPAADQTRNLRTYSADDAHYVVVGGETCTENDPNDDCPPSGQAIDELGMFHYSILSSGWNYLVNNDWVVGHCMDEIKRRLGYRFVLRSGHYSAGTVAAGNALHIEVSMANVGFAAPYNGRRVEIVLKNSQREYIALLNEDPRRWQPGSIRSIVANICTPPDMPSGEYYYYLNLPDPALQLSSRSEFSIRLANSNMVFDQKGHNGLGASVLIVPSGAPTSIQCPTTLTLRN